MCYNRLEKFGIAITPPVSAAPTETPIYGYLKTPKIPSLDRAGAYDLIKRNSIKQTKQIKATIPVIAAIPVILASLKSLSCKRFCLYSIADRNICVGIWQQVSFNP